MVSCGKPCLSPTVGGVANISHAGDVLLEVCLGRWHRYVVAAACNHKKDMALFDWPVSTFTEGKLRVLETPAAFAHSDRESKIAGMHREVLGRKN